MRILLPPSEGKAPKGRGHSLSRRGLEGPLADARLAVLEAVSAWCASDPAAAAAGLALPPSTAAADLEVNVAVLTAPTMPAVERFQGVVFDGLAWSTMDQAQRRTAQRCVLIASGAFGLLGAGEPVPDHRVPMSASVPGIGGLTPYWRRQLETTIAELGRHLVIDLRSTDYVAAPPVLPGERKRVLQVKVLTDKAGVRTVVSYSSKLTKGQLARVLVEAEAKGDKVRNAKDVAEIAAAAGFLVETGRSANGQPTLDVILAGLAVADHADVAVRLATHAAPGTDPWAAPAVTSTVGQPVAPQRGEQPDDREGKREGLLLAYAVRRMDRGRVQRVVLQARWSDRPAGRWRRRLPPPSGRSPW